MLGQYIHVALHLLIHSGLRRHHSNHSNMVNQHLRRECNSEVLENLCEMHALH